MVSIENRLDIAAMIATVGPEFTRLRRLVQSRVYAEIARRDTSQLITLKLRPSGRTISPSPNLEYIRYLWDYLKGKSTVESASVEEIALVAARNAVEEFYTSDATLEILGRELIRQLDSNAALKSALIVEIGGTAKWLRSEVSTALGGSAKVAVGGHVLDSATHAMNSALHTAGGQAVAGLAAKALAIPAVKIALVKAIIAAAHSVAFQKLVLIAVKKIGVAALVQIFAVKLAAAGGGGTIPGLGWIVTAAVGGLLIYDYKTLPGKLADKISNDLANTLSARANELHKTIVLAFGKVALEEIAPHFANSAN
jgi:hypothetical protein